MKYIEFAEKLEKEYKERFPRSMCKVRLFEAVGSGIFIDCYLAENEHEFINRIAQNDMFCVGFYISLPNNYEKHMELPEKLVMESTSNTYKLKSDNRYICYDTRKISYRKTTGSPEKLISTAGKFFDKVLAALKEDKDSGKIHDNFRLLVMEKLAGTK